MAPPKKLPPVNAELSPPEIIPGKANLIAPGLLVIVPSAPEIAAPPMAPPNTALHVLCQSHFTGFQFPPLAATPLRYPPTKAPIIHCKNSPLG